MARWDACLGKLLPSSQIVTCQIVNDLPCNFEIHLVVLLWSFKNWNNWRMKIVIEQIEEEKSKLKKWGENWNCHLSNCQRKFEMHLLWSFKSTNWSFKGLSGTINLLSVQFPIFSWLDFQDWKFLWRVYSRVLRKIANQNRKGVRRRDEDAIIGGGPLEGPKGS